jgi:hypothetical protein
MYIACVGSVNKETMESVAVTCIQVYRNTVL